MKRFIATMLVTAALTAGMNSPAFTADNLKVDLKKPLTVEAVKKMTKDAAPSDMHMKIFSMLGTWDYTVTYKTAADAEPQVSTGKISNEIVLGERFLSSKASGVMNVGGHQMPYEGEGLIGYNNIEGKYTSVWADTLGTDIMTGEGVFDEKTNAIVIEGQFTPPLVNQKVKFREEIEFTDSDTHKRTIYTKDASGKEFAILEIVYSKGNS